MIKSFLKISLLFLILSFTFFSCSSGCDQSDATADAEMISELAEAYIADVLNDEKCKDYVDALKQFVSDYRDCDDADQSSLDSIEQSIAALPCG